MSRRHGGLRPRRCAGGGIRGVVNDVGGSPSLLITVTAQLTLTRLVVSVDDTHGALHVCDTKRRMLAVR